MGWANVRRGISAGYIIGRSTKARIQQEFWRKTRATQTSSGLTFSLTVKHCQGYDAFLEGVLQDSFRRSGLRRPKPQTHLASVRASAGVAVLGREGLGIIERRASTIFGFSLSPHPMRSTGAAESPWRANESPTCTSLSSTAFLEVSLRRCPI